MLEIQRLQASEGERWRSIRLASLGDAPDAFGTTLAEASVRPLESWSMQLLALPTFVAVRDGEDVGVARGAPDVAEKDTAFLLSMWAAPHARGTGVGGALVDAVVDWAQAEGFSRLMLDVADANEPAIALYARKGFEPSGEVGMLPAPRRHILEHRRVLVLASTTSTQPRVFPDRI